MARVVIPDDQEIITVLPSAARTADTTSDQYEVGEADGLVVIIDATAASATPSVVFTIRGVSPTGSDTYNILSSAAITGVSNTRLTVHSDLTAAANSIAKDIVPPIFEVFCDHADADSITYSIEAQIIR